VKLSCDFKGKVALLREWMVVFRARRHDFTHFGGWFCPENRFIVKQKKRRLAPLLMVGYELF